MTIQVIAKRENTHLGTAAKSEVLYSAVSVNSAAQERKWNGGTAQNLGTRMGSFQKKKK